MKWLVVLSVALFSSVIGYLEGDYRSRDKHFQAGRQFERDQLNVDQMCAAWWFKGTGEPAKFKKKVCGEQEPPRQRKRKQ